ncbi:MAG: class A beta-lactamase-related serine hydrolase [Caldilinea sp. CFX5]|nr:class A beta-lactamase-related serine hydrolase [Caldilinea sp. CFX5]
MPREPRWFLFLLMTVGGLLLMSRQNAAQSPLDGAAIDQFISEQMAAQRIPGLALAIIQGDQVRYRKGYGVARADQPMTLQTQFHIASLSKSFTAVAIMQLVEADKIDLDAPVQRYLPEFTLADPTAAQQITVRQLLNQTSGLADAGVPDLRLARPATSAERIATLRDAHTVAMPGREFHYTDVNYQILGRVVEVVSGQPFSAYLREQIFAPLQMTNTVNVMTSFEIAQTADHLAQGHLLAFGTPIASGEETGYLGGSAGVISTAADMAHYLLMHNNAGRFQGQQILSATSIVVLHTPPPNSQSTYAMGWLADMVNGHQVLAHNGILSTFYADMVLLPESHQGFVLLYNIHSLAQDTVGFPKIKAGMIALLTGGQPAPGGVSVGRWGILLALITIVSVVLEVRGLWRFPRWRQQAVRRAGGATCWR